MDCDFFTISGWVFGFVSLIIAIYQLWRVEQYKKQVLQLKQINKDGGTGYQSAGDMTVNND